MGGEIKFVSAFFFVGHEALFPGTQLCDRCSKAYAAIPQALLLL